MLRLRIVWQSVKKGGKTTHCEFRSQSHLSVDCDDLQAPFSCKVCEMSHNINCRLYMYVI